MLPYLTDWAVAIHENNRDRQKYCIYAEGKLFLSLHPNHQVHDLDRDFGPLFALHLWKPAISNLLL